MTDLAMVAIVVIFFCCSVGYVFGCEREITRNSKREELS